MGMRHNRFVVVGVLAATVGTVQPPTGRSGIPYADLPPTCITPSVCDHTSPNDQPVALRWQSWSVSSGGSLGTSFAGVLPSGR